MYVVVLCSVSAFGRVDNDYAFGYVAVLRRPRLGVFSALAFLGWPLLALCLCCRFCWCPSFRRLHNDVFLVGVCGCGFRLGVLLCGRGVSCLVCCLFSCGVCWLFTCLCVLVLFSVLWVMSCVVLCRYPRFVLGV